MPARARTQLTHGVALSFESRRLEKIPVDGFIAIEFGGTARTVAGGAPPLPFVLLCNVCVRRRSAALPFVCMYAYVWRVRACARGSWASAQVHGGHGGQRVRA